MDHEALEYTRSLSALAQGCAGVTGQLTLASGARVRPNPSFNRTRYGRHRKAGLRHMVHHLSPALRCSASAGRLTRTLGVTKQCTDSFTQLRSSRPCNAISAEVLTDRRRDVQDMLDCFS